MSFLSHASMKGLMNHRVTCSPKIMQMMKATTKPAAPRNRRMRSSSRWSPIDIRYSSGSKCLFFLGGADLASPGVSLVVVLAELMWKYCRGQGRYAVEGRAKSKWRPINWAVRFYCNVGSNSFFRELAMRSLMIIVFIFFAFGSITLAAPPPLVIHEWGTFTNLQDESGKSVGGINSDDE